MELHWSGKGALCVFVVLCVLILKQMGFLFFVLTQSHEDEDEFMKTTMEIWMRVVASACENKHKEVGDAIKKRTKFQRKVIKFFSCDDFVSLVDLEFWDSFNKKIFVVI